MAYIISMIDVLIIVHQAFEMCRTGGFNLSYESLTSYEARQKLRDLKMTDPDFWNELTQKTIDAVDMADGNMPEDEDISEVPFEDDSDLPCEVIIARVLGSDLGPDVTSMPDGNLMSTAAAESLDRDETKGLSDVGEGNAIPPIDSERNNLGRGKRKITKNKLYDSFWRHNDRDASDCEDDH
jgi:hypothetical protein